MVPVAKYYTKEPTGKENETRTVRHRIYLGQQYELTDEQVKYLGKKISKTKPSAVKEAEEASENKIAAAGENKSE